MAISMKDAYRVMFKEFPDVVDVDQMSRRLGSHYQQAGRKVSPNHQAQNDRGQTPPAF